jgi:hypothetical protein
MSDGAAALRADPISWLLEDDDPSVRYFTLTGLLGSASDDDDVVTAKRAIMSRGAVPSILAAQADDGHWEGPDRFYQAKYRGTVWQLVILASLGADGTDQGVRAGCEAILRDSQDTESGGFAADRAKKAGGGLHSYVIPCLTGNMVWSLIRLGMLDDPRVQRGVEWITTYQRFDDGADEAPTGWPYDRFEMCWGRHTCHMGAVKAIKALAAIPPDRRSPEVERTLAEGAEFMLRHHVHKRSHDLTKLSKPGWRHLGFPLMYQTDLLEILGILTSLGYHDDRMGEALDLLAGKADAQGRWTLENTFNDRFVVPIETKGKPSKWVTLEALRVLRAQ